MGLNAVYGIEVAALRYFNVFGPRQDPNSQYSGVIPKFLPQALDGAPLVVFDDGTQSRDFTYVDSVVAATLSATECRLDGPLICDVRCGSSHTVLALAEAVGRVAERAVQIEYVPARPGDVLHSYADITVAREALGYDPTVGLEEGLERTLAWMLAERHTSSSAALSEKR
jgi:UDP-glucose 4-epimerase